MRIQPTNRECRNEHWSSETIPVQLIENVSEKARLRATRYPAGLPIMHQSWDKLLFLHWAVRTEDIRALIPCGLDIDTYCGQAWVTITPLYIHKVRPVFLPPIPIISSFFELNVRTYVYRDGVPGIWFFSLDANSSLAVAGAQTFFKLPYFNADIRMEYSDRLVTFNSKRSDSSASFSARWVIGDDLPQARAGSLEFFLMERYVLYSADDENLFRCRINHRPWPLQATEDLLELNENITEVHGLPPISDVRMNCGGPVDVWVWPLEKIESLP